MGDRRCWEREDDYDHDSCSDGDSDTGLDTNSLDIR